MRPALMLALAAFLLPAPFVLANDPPPESDWASQYRGTTRDGISPETGLLKSWPSGGPKVAWKTRGVGGGYSSISISGDKLFTMGDVDGACQLLALNVSDGKIVWKTRVGQPVGHRKYPGPRCTPATDGELVFALGQFGDLVCVEAESGKEKWRKNLEKNFGGRMMSGWKFSESPLLDGDHVVVTPGGSRGAVLALKKDTGATVWQSKGITDRAGYCSLVPVEIGGARQYIVFTGNSVAGVAAEDGKVLWKSARQGKTAICSTPVYKDGVVFVSSAYGIGCNAFRVTESGGTFTSEEIYAGKQIQSHHGGMIVLGDHVYGLGQRSLKCIEIKTGKVVWEDRSVGKGAIAYADGHFIARSERGPIALVEATPEGYKEKGRFNQPDRSEHRAWPHPVVFGGKLYIRDQDVLICYDVKGN